MSDSTPKSKMSDCSGGCGRRMQIRINMLGAPLCKKCRPAPDVNKTSCADCGTRYWTRNPNKTPRCMDCRRLHVVHGKQSTYTHRGCRCDECRAANCKTSSKVQKRLRHERGLLKLRKCVICEGSFTHPRRGQITCSPQCRRTYSGKSGSHRSRAIFYGVAYERINRVEVFKRDEWKCGLCSDPVDPALVYPHPLSASLDHVVPISRRGPHTYDNVQCAHLTCNRNKSNSFA